MTEHISSQFEEELVSIRDRLMQMGTRVELMVQHSVEALLQGKESLAREVITTDLQVNLDEVELDEACLETIVRRQPAASDMRFLTLALKIVTDMERIGDLAVNISERAIELQHWEGRTEYEEITTMAESANQMLSQALTSFVNRDDVMAEAVLDLDDEVDQTYRLFFGKLLKAARNSDKPDQLIGLLFAGKSLERVADHATNIAEMVVFMIRGKDIRHLASRENV